jgi:hypothetical protein
MYNRTRAMKDAKAEACGTKEPGLHPVVKKEPRPLQPSDKRVVFEKLCRYYAIPPHDLYFSWSHSYREVKAIEKQYGKPLNELEDWCGFTEYHRLWVETRAEFIRKHYKGK